MRKLFKRDYLESHDACVRAVSLQRPREEDLSVDWLVSYSDLVMSFSNIEIKQLPLLKKLRITIGHVVFFQGSF